MYAKNSPHQEGESVWEGGKTSVTNCMLGKQIHAGEKEGGEAHEYWNDQSRCCLLLFQLLVFGTLSTFITLLHLVYSASSSTPPPLSAIPLFSSPPSPPSFLHASRTLKSLRGAAASCSNESVCCHFSDARCEIKRAVYVRAVAGIKRRAHIGRRQLLQSLQAHIYVPFVQFAICCTKPIF